MENDQNLDPYEVVLADLRAKMERIGNTIALLESLKAGGDTAMMQGSFATATAVKPKDAHDVDAIGPGAFFGLTVHDATIKILRAKRRELQTTDLVPELER